MEKDKDICCFKCNDRDEKSPLDILIIKKHKLILCEFCYDKYQETLKEIIVKHKLIIHCKRCDSIISTNGVYKPNLIKGYTNFFEKLGPFCDKCLNEIYYDIINL